MPSGSTNLPVLLHSTGNNPASLQATFAKTKWEGRRLVEVHPMTPPNAGGFTDSLSLGQLCRETINVVPTRMQGRLDAAKEPESHRTYPVHDLVATDKSLLDSLIAGAKEGTRTSNDS